MSSGPGGSFTMAEGIKSQCYVLGPSNQFRCHIDVQNIAANGVRMLVDLSDTVRWPHALSGHIDLEEIWASFNPSAAFAGDIQLGFLSGAGTAGSTLNVLHTWHFQQSAAPMQDRAMFGHLHVGAEEWYGPRDTADTNFQTDVGLIGPRGDTDHVSGDGDLVLNIIRSAGNIDIGLSYTYETRGK